MIWRKVKPSSQPEQQPKGFDAYDLRLGDLMRGERATMGKSLLDVQRELKIKATVIAAIENADVSVFETPGFVAGYVRSYARYLGMDPDAAYRQFCTEANFSPIPKTLGGSSPAARPRQARPRPTGLEALGHPDALFVPRGPSWTSRIEPGAAGSVLVLLALIGGIGYGGWSVLREVQRVHVAPVEQSPEVVVSVDPLGDVTPGAILQVADSDPVAQAPTAEALGRLYRPQALEVPQLVSRDGPIAAIITERAEALAQNQAPTAGTPAEVLESTPVKVLAEAAPAVEIIAVKPAWMRVRAADGTVLFEQILDTGKSYVVPQSDAPPTLRAGNSGAVYFMVKGKAYGPAAAGAQVVSNLALSPEKLEGSFAEVDLTAKPDVARVVELVQERYLTPGGAAETAE
ncbi:helix-turn-helix domain-containing protein [Falsigemmobacter faecalis]|uniref:Helix-turn-helix domain-containing protein n=1 Tax=Falsigemmobacter faecalis TaxID=2488730 RepID=A0A3P3DV03_9RHOB|nr:helix-turn-helix domain-containing protein [Falsigemmobacter faecalis]RRH77302.1 helix-turn-helix domain-containing protein [Falsigemmobacter faecalis]